MQRHEIVRLRLVASALVLSIAVPLPSLAAKSYGAQCQPATEKMDIDPANYGVCVKLRTNDDANAITLTEKSAFGTRCPVTIKVKSVPAPTMCSKAAQSLQNGDIVRINEWPNEIFELVILRKGRPLFPMQPLQAIKVKFPSENDERTLGYYADVDLPQDLEVVGDPHRVRYNVYVRWQRQKGEAKPTKFYWLEVFDRDDEKCLAEQPSGTLSKIVRCEDLDTPPPACPTPPCDGEYPSGGGGEPPPKTY